MGRRPNGRHHPVTIYAKQVTQGRLRSSCCKWEILACQRHLDDLNRQENDPDFPYVFDETRADRIIRFFSLCRHVRGPFAGQPIELLDWQVFDQGCLFGWVHKETGARRFTIAYNKRARGNVKSTENSVKCLYFMTADAIYPPYQPELARYEAMPEVLCAAVDKGQAKRVYGDAKEIALASPDIARRLIVKQTRCFHRQRGGTLQALSKATDNKDSGAPTYYVVDEYHAHKTSVLYDLGLNSFGKRWQPLHDTITTAGDDAENKPCYKEEVLCKQLLENPEMLRKKDDYFIMIREIDDGDDPHDMKCWVKANPVLRSDTDYSRTLRLQIESEYRTAYMSGIPEKIRTFLTRRMCRWQAASDAKYLSEAQLQLARQAMVKPSEFAKLTDGRRCHCGYDLGKRIDLTGVAAVFDLPDGRIAVKMHGFMPLNGATRHEHSDRVPYVMWAKDGHVTLTPGDVTDNSYVYNWICENERNHNWLVLEVDYDGHNATDLAIRMREDRARDDFCVEIAQTCAGLNQATKRFRELLLQGQIVIEENPMALWCLGNAVEITNNYGDIKLSKRHKDDSQRIDPVAAAMNALARLLVRIDNHELTLTEKLESGTFGM